MHIPFGRILAGLAVFGLPLFAQAQVVGGGVTSIGVVHGAMGFPGQASVIGSPVTGAPYSAQRVFEHLQVGMDGTRFTSNDRQEAIYRDSEGWVRTDRPVTMGPNAPVQAPVIVEIQDPVAKVGYTLDTQNRVAHRVAWPAVPNQSAGAGAAQVRSGLFMAATNSMGGALAVAAPPPPPPPGGSVPGFAATPAIPTGIVIGGQHEDRARSEGTLETQELGQQMIEDVMAQGHRTSRTLPTGAMGNDRPFQITSETWYSPELHETVLSKNSDPRYGETTTRLININRAEPSPSLFSPPPDYSVTDETGPFQIRWSMP